MNELLHRYGGHYVGYEALWMSRDLYLNVWRDNVINENKEAASGVLKMGHHGKELNHRSYEATAHRN